MTSAALPRAVVVALSRYRQRWGLTLEQLAQRTGAPAATLARFEEGIAVPDPEVAESLIVALQLDDVSATALRAAAEGKRAEARSEPAPAGGRFAGWDKAATCRVTTIGRRSGRPHDHECPLFVTDGDRLFLLDAGGGGAAWARDVQANPGVSVRVTAQRVHAGHATVLGVGHPDADRARVLAARKYPDRQDEIAGAAVVAVESFTIG